MARSKKAQKAYRKRQHRHRLLYRYKRLKGCAVCGELNNLEFHAPDGHKGGHGNHISRRVGRGTSWQRIKQEVLGCDVLCRTHHVELHNWLREEAT